MANSGQKAEKESYGRKTMSSQGRVKLWGVSDRTLGGEEFHLLLQGGKGKKGVEIGRFP